MDTSTLGVTTTRRGLAMIPQDAVVITGSGRDNVDPFGEETDAAVRAAFATVGLPAALIDSIGDLCLQLGPRGAPPGCGVDHGWRMFHRLRGARSAALSDTYDPVNLAFDPALPRGLDTSNLLVAALVLGCAWMGFRQLRRAMQRDDPNYAHGL